MQTRLTMLELEHMHEEQIFGKIKTIEEIRDMTEPPLHYNTILNALQLGKLTYTMKGGVYLIYLPSARNLWRKRFLTKGQ